MTNPSVGFELDLDGEVPIVIIRGGDFDQIRFVFKDVDFIEGGKMRFSYDLVNNSEVSDAQSEQFGRLVGNIMAHIVKLPG